MRTKLRDWIGSHVTLFTAAVLMFTCVLVTGIIFVAVQSSGPSHDYTWGVNQANTICRSHKGVSRITDSEYESILTYVCRDGIAGTVDY